MADAIRSFFVFPNPFYSIREKQMLYKHPKNGKIKAVLVLSSPSSIIEYYLVFKNKFVTFIRALAKSVILTTYLCTNFRNLCTNCWLI